MSLHIADLPALNAGLNALASVFLLLGWRAIKAGRPERHRRWMLCALTVSALFLTSYLVYHTHTQFVRHYAGTGIDRSIYYFILLTHIPLAGGMVPFILAALWLAWRKNFNIDQLSNLFLIEPLVKDPRETSMCRALEFLGHISGTPRSVKNFAN